MFLILHNVDSIENKVVLPRLKNKRCIIDGKTCYHGIGQPCQDPKVCPAALPALVPSPFKASSVFETQTNLQFAGRVFRRRSQVGETSTQLSLDLFYVGVDLRYRCVRPRLKNWVADPLLPLQPILCQEQVELEGKCCSGGDLHKF